MHGCLSTVIKEPRKLARKKVPCMFLRCHQRFHQESYKDWIKSKEIKTKKKRKKRNREDTSLGSPDPGLYWPVVIASPEASELSGAEPVAILPRSGDVAQIGPPLRASHQIRRHHRGRSSSTPVDLLAGLLAAAGRGGTPCGGGRGRRPAAGGRQRRPAQLLPNSIPKVPPLPDCSLW